MSKEKFERTKPKIELSPRFLNAALEAALAKQLSDWRKWRRLDYKNQNVICGLKR